MITVEVIGATLTEEFGGSETSFGAAASKEPISIPEREVHLSFRVKLAEDERILLSDGTRLSTFEGFVTVYPRVESFDATVMGIGVLTHHGAFSEAYFASAPARFHVQVQIPAQQFEDVLAATRMGRIPNHITFHERGMMYPDEFSKTWDEKANPKLHIAAISFSIPLTAHAAQESEVLVNRHAKDIHSFFSTAKRIDTKLKWIVFLATVIVGLVLVRILGF